MCKNSVGLRPVYFLCMGSSNKWQCVFHVNLRWMLVQILPQNTKRCHPHAFHIYLSCNQSRVAVIRAWFAHIRTSFACPTCNGETGSQELGPCDCRRYDRRVPYLAEIAIQLNLTIGLRWWHEYGSGYIPLKIAVLVEWCWWSVFISCRVCKARRGGRGRVVQTVKPRQPPFGDVTKTESQFATPVDCTTNFIM